MDPSLYTDYHLLGLLVLFPLIGAIINGLVGSRLSQKTVDWIGVGSMYCAFMIAIKAFVEFQAAGVEHVTYEAFSWIYAGSFEADIAFLLDPLSSIMILVVTGVGFLIHVYSVGYMKDDPGKWKYFSYLNLFIFAMLMLVLGKNLLVTFIGWEGVGACSYLLIGFWYTDEAKAQAGLKAFVVNRVGDFAFLLGLFLLYAETGTLDYVELDNMATTAGHALRLAPIAFPAVILIFVGCTGKSAQIPLYTWLPDAMAGPTPVSALIHAATMVTSGVYLLARLNHLVTLSWTAMMVIAVVGALTAFMAATIALVQNDIKRVLAYSTVSQLGYMFLAIGVGSFVGAIFHLVTHAFFKALLFLGSGSVIHSMGGDQDIRNMGGLRKHMPITHWTFLIATIAIAGVPFIAAGFYSKDMILWGALSNVHVFQVEDVAYNINYLTGMMAPELGAEKLAVAPWTFYVYFIVYLTGVITAFLTAFYMFRLYILTFLGECRADEETKSHLHESPMSMTIPLAALAILSVVGGFVGFPHVIAHAMPESLGHSMLWIEEFLKPVFEYSMEFRISNQFGEHAAAREVISIVVGSSVALLGIATAFLLYVWRPGLKNAIYERAQLLYRVLASKYKIDELYDFAFVRGAKGLGRLWAAFDEFIVDGVFVNGIGFIAESIGKILRNLQSGDVQRYATYIVLAIVLVMVALI